MELSIKDKKQLYFNNTLIYEAKEKLYKAQFFGNNKIILHVRDRNGNLLCIDKMGKIIWKAESISPVEYLAYQDFTIIDGRLHATALMPVYSVDAIIDTDTGKVISKENFR